MKTSLIALLATALALPPLPALADATPPPGMLPTASNAALPSAVQNLGLLDGTDSYFTFGTGLYPLYAIPATTTANTTNGQPTITVASASGIVIGDSIWATFVPAGTLVTNIAGTTVTMSANATATGTGTTVQFGQARFSAGTTALSNTLAAQRGYFGAASKGHSTWLNKYAIAYDYPDVAALLTLSIDGQTATAAATRDSDNPGANATQVIANTVNLVSDSNANWRKTWANYFESDLVGSAVGQHLQTESTINSTWSPVTLDPYTDNAQGMTVNLRLDCGIGANQNCSAPLDILNTGAAYQSGIIFSSTALATSGGIGSAVQLPQNYALDWFSAAGNKAWRLYSNASSGNNTLVLGNSGATFSSNVIIGGGAPAAHSIFFTANLLAFNGGTTGYTFNASDNSSVFMSLTPGMQVGAPTGGDKGIGTINASGGVYDNGTAPSGTAGTGYVRATGATLTDPILPGFTVATSTLTKTSDTTLATVPGLSIALTAGKTYSCHGHLTGVAGASGGLKVALIATNSLSATSASFTGFMWNGTTAVARTTVTALGSNIAANTAIYSDLDIEGAIVVNAGGTINVQAAQNASNSTATTVLLNSTFRCVRVN